MERVPRLSTDTSAGLWVSRVTSRAGGWGRHTQSTEGGGLHVREAAGCQDLYVCVHVCEQHTLAYIKKKKDDCSVFPSVRTPSPADFNRRRACGPDVEDILPGQNTPPTQAEMLGQGSLTPRAQLGSRPHTPVGRVDIRPRDDSRPQTLYYTPASPKLESSATPTTPVTERWQNLNKVRAAS